MALEQLVDQVATYYEAHPDARLSTQEAAELFQCSAYSLRQAMYLLRRRGMQVRCVRVYQLRRRESGGK